MITHLMQIYKHYIIMYIYLFILFIWRVRAEGHVLPTVLQIYKNYLLLCVLLFEITPLN